MSIIDWFAQREKHAASAERLNIPGELWIKCKNCAEVLFLKDLEREGKVCPHCEYHFRIDPIDRINLIFDSETFTEIYSEIGPKDFLNFEDTHKYSDRIIAAQKKTGVKDAIRIGHVKLCGRPVNIAVMDFSFMGGSMGSVVGEKVTLITEAAIENGNPLIIFTSSGGARMQEGVLSLMQMAKTSAALSRLAKKAIPFISVLCDPTTGGTSASYAMLGDINIAEPGALISFAGPRVIEQTLREKLPKGFQRSEFLLKHGMVDIVVGRKKLRESLSGIFSVLCSPIKDEVK